MTPAGEGGHTGDALQGGEDALTLGWAARGERGHRFGVRGDTLSSVGVPHPDSGGCLRGTATPRGAPQGAEGCPWVRGCSSEPGERHPLTLSLFLPPSPQISPQASRGAAAAAAAAAAPPEAAGAEQRDKERDKEKEKERSRGTGPREAREARAETRPRAGWARLLQDPPGRRHKGLHKKGLGKGCFGLKLDRIGAMSGLGC